jgi:hypothetical protein
MIATVDRLRQRKLSRVGSADRLYPLRSPPQPGLTEQKLVDMFRQTIQAAPTLGDRPFGMGLLIALKRTYPCPAP